MEFLLSSLPSPKVLERELTQFVASLRAVGMMNPLSDKDERLHPGGGGGEGTCDHGLSRRSLRVKRSYALSREVKVIPNLK